MVSKLASCSRCCQWFTWKPTAAVLDLFLVLERFLASGFLSEFLLCLNVPKWKCGGVKVPKAATIKHEWTELVAKYLSFLAPVRAIFFWGQFELCSIFFHYVASGIRSTVANHQSLTKWVILNPLTLEVGDIWMILGGLLAFTIVGMSWTSLPPKGGAYPIKSKETFQ